MTALGLLILVILLVPLPLLVGSVFVNVDKSLPRLPFMWISGQVVLWAGFQVLSVPVILTEGSFRTVVLLFSLYTIALVVLATICYLMKRKKGVLPVTEQGGTEKSEGHYMMFFGHNIAPSGWLWIVFWGLLAFQLFQAVYLSYADGDDSFFVAVSGLVENSNEMYRKDVYTGWPSVLDVRHGMAPFPIWISYLARVSGIKAVSVAHIAMPLILIPMTYALYYLLADKLFVKRKECIPLFLILTQILVLFGDYSYYTVERFMIARSRQGKAALGSIVIPMLFLLLLILLERLQEQQKIGWLYWMLFVGVLLTGCLCSTLGALLVCMLVGISGLCAAFAYRRWWIVIPMGICCMPCVVYAGLYLLLG